MPDITFIQPDGSEQGFEAPVGVSVMQAATGADVAGIVAECGGSAICGTCHVYVDAPWAALLPPPSPIELETLECVAAERKPTSRLSCQIQLTAAMQGLLIHVPDSQY
ncbi:2Fe-2S iron-sulfur cluster-binding protein [soil metagenome]